jgi:hypothetical protein
LPRSSISRRDWATYFSRLVRYQARGASALQRHGASGKRNERTVAL